VKAERRLNPSGRSGPATGRRRGPADSWVGQKQIDLKLLAGIDVHQMRAADAADAVVSGRQAETSAAAAGRPRDYRAARGSGWGAG